MNIALFGATGAIGSLFLKLALDNGDTVYAYARRPEKIKIQHDNLHMIKGDLTDESAMEAAIIKADIVISTMGPSLKSKRSDMSTPIADGHALIIKVMKRLNKSRLITLATPSIHADSDPNSALLKMIPFGAKLLYPWAFRDMVKLGGIIKSTIMDWTVIRIMSPNAKSSGNGYDVVVGQNKSKMSVSRENVAKFFYDVAKNNTFIREMPIVFNH